MSSFARKKIANYRQVQKSTTSPAQRVVMCYDRVQRDLETAVKAFDDDSPSRFATIHNAVDHAGQILLELQLALDNAAAPELSDSLQDLYTFWINHLSDGNARKDPEPIRHVLEMISEMKETWQEAARAAANT